MSNSLGSALRAVYPVIFLLVFAAIAGIVIFSFFRMARRRKHPLLMVDARVAGKRSETGEGGEEVYFLEFVLPTGDRMELQASREESEMMEIGDEGKVAFRGIRFDSFYDKIESKSEDKA